MTFEPQNAAQKTARPAYATELDRVIDLLNAMIPGGTEPCHAGMCLGTLIAEKSLYPDLIVEAFGIAVPSAKLEAEHFVPERTIEQVVSLLHNRASAPSHIDY